MRFYAVAAVVAGLLAGACAPKHDQAEALDNAAGQSDPAAAAQLHDQADAMRDNGVIGNLSAENSTAQQALETAGNEAATTPR